MKIGSKTRIVIVTILVTLVSAMLAAQTETAKPAVETKPAEPKYTEIKYSADASSYKYEGADRILVLKGNVKFVQGDTVLVADKIDYRESTRTAVASGNLKIYDDQSTITGETCTVNFKEKKGTLTGSVHMVAKPKPKPETTTAAADTSKPKSLRSEFKDEVDITCDKIEYWYKDKRAVVSSPLKMIQKTRTLTADSGTYLGKDEIVELVGNVKGTDDKEKHSFSAPKVTVSLKKDAEWIEAEKATGSFYVKEEEETPPAEKAPEKAPAKPAVTPVAEPGP